MIRPLLALFISVSYFRIAVSFSPLDLEVDDYPSRRTTGVSLLPMNPYVSDVKLTLSDIPEEQEQSKLLVADLLTNEVAAARIESFSIDYSCFHITDGGGSCGCGDFLDPFIELINRGRGYLKVLKRVKCTTTGSTLAVRRELLTSLEEHFPNLNLDLEMRWGDPSTLQSSPLLHSLRVYFAPSKLDTTGTSPLLTHVQTQIMDSPNLVELSMGINSMGCVIYRTDPKFARLKEKRFPHLEKLSLEAFPLTVENVDYWMANMDWSHVEHLDLRAIYQPTYFFNESIKLAGGLPQLKALHMELPWFRERRDLQEFEEVFRQFLDTPRNTGLSVIALEGDFRPYLQTILNRHGGSLKRLQLHDPERSHGPQREMLSDSDLRDLGQRAPHLEDISIDINNGLNGSLPMGFVETLLSETGFPSLKTIELFGILGVSDPVRVSDWPYVPTDQRPLLSKLFSRPAINQVKIHVGEDRRLGGGYPARWVLWEQDNQELWVAERDASGEMVLKASPRVWDEEGYGWREGYH